MNRRLRQLPAVEKVLQQLQDEFSELPRASLATVIRQVLTDVRRRSAHPIPSIEELLAEIRSAARRQAQRRIQPVINAAGIVIHTNLGRAPLAPVALQTLASTNAGYNSLEFDLSSGDRGSRGTYVESHLALLCQSEASLVVNNCAAGLFLILHELVTEAQPEVIISRGELVQIGGGFRIPEILESAGAVLREVGTTNRTSLRDFAAAIGKKTALILKVHRSNFIMDGFVESVGTRELAALARQRKIPMVEDLGSGAILDTAAFPGLDHEPTPAEVLKCGADLVCFSGDKLFGGPQAGIVAGKARRISALKRNPLFRALRCDKLVLTALQATVDLYLHAKSRPDLLSDLPLARLLSTPPESLMERAQAIVGAAKCAGLDLEISPATCQVGGGTLPRSALPSVVLQVSMGKLSAAKIADRLRAACPPVIGYVARHRCCLDLRTVLPEQDPLLVNALRAAAALGEEG